MRNIVYFILFFTISTSLEAIESLKLTDPIKSNGIGDINLLKDISSLDLEAYRNENNSILVLGVDVNEAADGTEKSSSQGITIKSVALNVILSDGSSFTFTDFYTETKVTVAEEGMTERYTFYTNIGDTGSNRITSSNSVQAAFDSTIKIPIDIDLSSAIVATIDIMLLKTNTSLGDPEAFYDYSNGFEDLAILNNTDSDFLDLLKAGRDEAPLVELTNPDPENDLNVSSTLFYPSANDYYTVAYEDLFPGKGDYDFNDLVVAYQVYFHLNSSNKLVKISGTAIMICRGASFNHDWKLKIELPSNSNGVFSSNISFPPAQAREPIARSTDVNGHLNETIFSNTKELFPNFNTFVSNEFDQGPKADFSVVFNSPVPLSQVSLAPFDPYIYVENTQFEVHLQDKNPTASSYNVQVNQTSFIDASGFPFAMILPTLWKYPYENRDLGLAYPSFIPFVQSAGTANINWYTEANDDMVKSYGMSEINWWDE